MKKGLEKLWCEKYRPQTIDDIIFQNEKDKKFFEKIVKTKQLPNLLFSGVQGTGKSTLSLVLEKELGINPIDVLLVKCSDETGVDNLRDKVSRFAESCAIGDYRLIRMEEADRLSQAAQDVLRHIIEDSSDNCRFIFTCNHVNKITPAVRSRLQEFHFKAPDKDAIILRMAEMLDNEGIDVDASIEALDKIVSVCYPDIRKTIQVLQQSVVNNKIIWDSGTESGSDYKFELLDLIIANDFDKARKLVCASVTDSDYEDLYRWLYQNVNQCPKFKDNENHKKAILEIANYIDKHSRSCHPDITLEALFISLGMI